MWHTTAGTGLEVVWVSVSPVLPLIVALGNHEEEEEERGSVCTIE